jgi:hypothetical protein
MDTQEPVNTAATDKAAPRDTTGTRPLSRVEVREILRVVGGVVALAVIYAAIPVDTDTTAGAIALMVVATVVFVLVTAHNLRQLRTSARPVLRAIRFIIVAVTLYLLGFATIYLAIYQVNPTSFNEPLSKLSSLYFTVAVLTTVGFGDIHAVTDGARAVVTAQMLGSIGLVAVLIRCVMHLATQRAANISGPVTDPDRRPPGTAQTGTVAGLPGEPPGE